MHATPKRAMLTPDVAPNWCKRLQGIELLPGTVLPQSDLDQLQAVSFCAAKSIRRAPSLRRPSRAAAACFLVCTAFDTSSSERPKTLLVSLISDPRPFVLSDPWSTPPDQSVAAVAMFPHFHRQPESLLWPKTSAGSAIERCSLCRPSSAAVSHLYRYS